jgi:hypothetical protein
MFKVNIYSTLIPILLTAVDVSTQTQTSTAKRSRILRDKQKGDFQGKEAQLSERQELYAIDIRKLVQTMCL